MNIRIIIADWHTHQETLKSIRTSVFIKEQKVPANDEWDNMDDKARHYLLYINNKAIACARILHCDLNSESYDKIGRVAVLKAYRHKGLATRLMNFIMNDARQQQTQRLKLDAQTYIIPFYEKLGFTVCSDEFIDAGIPHKSMQRFIETDSL